MKDHKPNFDNTTITRLINPAKNEIGRLSKAIIKQLKNTSHPQQWNTHNTRRVIDWFKNIQNKSEYKFMMFDNKELLGDAINFANLILKKFIL